MGGEHIVDDNVEAGKDWFAVEVAVTDDHGSEDGDSGDDAPVDEQFHLFLQYHNINSNGQTNQSCKGPT